MTKLTVTLKVNKMAEEVQAFGFPCGETNCMKLATHEFQFATLDDDYRLPLCARHAQRMEQAIHGYEQRSISAND
jgi:hypothetical protein